MIGSVSPVDCPMRPEKIKTIRTAYTFAALPQARTARGKYIKSKNSLASRDVAAEIALLQDKRHHRILIISSFPFRVKQNSRKISSNCLDNPRKMCYSNVVRKPYTQLYLGVAQVVARYLGVVEAARSSRVTQTNIKRDARRRLF